MLFNIDGIAIHAGAATSDYDPHAYADAKAADLGIVSQSGVASLRALYDPSRVRVTVTLVPKDFYSNYIAGQAAEAYAAWATSTMESMMMMPMGAGVTVFAVTDIDFLSGEPVVTWPGQLGHYYVVETCGDLEDGDWVAVVLRDGAASDIAWTDTSGDSFALVRVREVPDGSPVDSDGDGLDDNYERANNLDPLRSDIKRADAEILNAAWDRVITSGCGTLTTNQSRRGKPRPKCLKSMP